MHGRELRTQGHMNTNTIDIGIERELHVVPVEDLDFLAIDCAVTIGPYKKNPDKPNNPWKRIQY